MTARRTAIALGALAIAAGAGDGTAQAVGFQHWVSGLGDDANPCTRTAPCATLQAALNVSPAGGTISVIDPGDYGPASQAGPVVITRAVTIDGGGGTPAQVTVDGTDGIQVAAGATDVVTIRDLSLAAAHPCATAGSADGIRYLSGGAVHVQDTLIHGFSGAGLAEQLSSAGTLSIDRSDVHDNCAAGVVATTAAGSAPLELADSLLTANATNVAAGSGATIRLAHNAITAGGVGVAAYPGGALVSAHNNRLAGNTSDFGPAGTVAGPPQAAAPGPVPAPAVRPPTCRVPRFAGRTLPHARLALARTICHLGTVTYRRVAGHRRGRVYAQQPAPGSVQLAGAVVNLRIAGPAPRARRHRAGGGRDPRRRRARRATTLAAVTWVSGVGDDANPCQRTAPCKTLAGALPQTAPGGTIMVSDPAEVGPATIDRPITIIGGGASSTSIQAASGNGLTIAAGGAGDVTLRNLAVSAATPCSSAGTGSGIEVQSARAVHLEGVSSSGFPDSGLKLDPGSDATATVTRSVLDDDCTAGLWAQRTGGPVAALVISSSLRNDATGVIAGDGSAVRLSDADISGAGVGVTTAGSGVAQGWGDDHIGANAADGTALTQLPFY